MSVDNISAEAKKDTDNDSNRVVLKATIDLGTKTDGIIDVDLWYTGAYEL